MTYSKLALWILPLGSFAAYILAVYVVASEPSDDTGYAVGIWLFASVWGFVLFAIWLSALLANRACRRVVYRFIGLVLMIPALWLAAMYIGVVLLRNLVARLHSSWSTPGGIADDGILLLLICSTLFVAGIAMILKSSVRD